MNMKENSIFSPRNEVVLGTLRRTDDDRTVAYAVCGDPNSGMPVLFFYAGGGNRRLLSSLSTATKRASLFMICVNRPGTGGTSPPLRRTTAATVAAVCEDAAAVLDELGVARVGLFFMCAGTPFALAFASQCASRLTGKAVGVAPYVQPADCPRAKALHRFGSLICCPRWLVSHLVGGVFWSAGMSLSSLPNSVVISEMKRKLTDKEREAFDEKFSKEDFVKDMAWMFAEGSAAASDVDVLMSPSADIGIKYPSVDACDVKILHGEYDQMTPIAASEWLAKQLPSATLTRLEGTHEGTLFLLHQPIVEAIEWLGKV